MVALALIVPSTVGEWDWNSVIQRIFTLALWIVFTVACYRILHRPRTYSAAATIAVFLIAATSYKTLQATEFLWASPLGPTNDDIAISIDRYASRTFLYNLRIISWVTLQRLKNVATSATYCGNTRTYAMLKPLPKSGWSIRLFRNRGIGQMFSFLLLTLCGLII